MTDHLAEAHRLLNAARAVGREGAFYPGQAPGAYLDAIKERDRRALGLRMEASVHAITALVERLDRETT